VFVEDNLAMLQVTLSNVTAETIKIQSNKSMKSLLVTNTYPDNLVLRSNHPEIVVNGLSVGARFG
jgi:hypothetical protein